LSEALHLYYEALNRLKEGTPIVLPKGTKISNDAVSLEAGRKKGSIKKSRSGFSELIEAIEQVQESQRERVAKQKEKHPHSGFQQDEHSLQTGTDAQRYRVMYDSLLAERAGVLLEAFKQREEIKSLRSTLAVQAVELSDLRVLASSLEAELTRLRAGRLQSVPIQTAKDD